MPRIFDNIELSFLPTLQESLRLAHSALDISIFAAGRDLPIRLTIFPEPKLSKAKIRFTEFADCLSECKRRQKGNFENTFGIVTVSPSITVKRKVLT